MARGKKPTYKEVKLYFENYDYILLENEYQNAHQKLKYQCLNNHLGEIRFNDFKTGYRCNQCAIENRANVLRYDYEYVYNYFKENGCELLEKEYKNGHTPMLYKCNCGNESTISFTAFRQGQRCKQCGFKKRIDPKKHIFITVFNYFLENDCLLLEKEYKNCKEKMKYQCKCGNIAYITYSSFKQGHRCSQCANNEKYTHDYVYNKFKDYNYELLENIYINSQTKMKFKCNNNHIGFITLSDLLRGRRCSECSIVHKPTYQEVYEYFKNHGCELLSKEYKNAHTKMEYRCECGNISYIAYHDFKKGQRCKKCQIEKIRQKLLNPNITQEERELKRTMLENDIWRKEVFERDNYTCQVCGQYGGNLNAHHLNGYHWCKEGRFDINNGITLCFNCHDHKVKGSFHQIYGNKNNTKEQFEEFLLFKNNQINIKQETG